MLSLSERISPRMADPKLNASFNREISKKQEITTEDKCHNALSNESFQEYKRKDPNWRHHVE
ncbi:MAG: hypothetical protein ABWX61_00820 [Paenisporosarcina sp.]